MTAIAAVGKSGSVPVSMATRSAAAGIVADVHERPGTGRRRPQDLGEVVGVGPVQPFLGQHRCAAAAPRTSASATYCQVCRARRAAEHSTTSGTIAAARSQLPAAEAVGAPARLQRALEVRPAGQFAGLGMAHDDQAPRSPP